jgi:hypothetical protein
MFLTSFNMHSIIFVCICSIEYATSRPDEKYAMLHIHSDHDDMDPA